MSRVLGNAKRNLKGGFAYLPGSELGGLLDTSPTSVDPRTKPVEAYGLDEDE